MASAAKNGDAINIIRAGRMRPSASPKNDPSKGGVATCFRKLRTFDTVSERFLEDAGAVAGGSETGRGVDMVDNKCRA